MLTGKHPTDEMFNNGLTLHKFVETAFPENIVDILDTSLIPCYKDEQTNHESPTSENDATVTVSRCIEQLAELGLKCSVEAPKDRPSMQDVYSEIATIRETFSALKLNE